MRLLRWIGRLPLLDRTPRASALREWRTLTAQAPGTPLEFARFVVVDTETSGLDPRRAELLSIGACRVDCATLGVDSGLELQVAPRTLSPHENVLVHGIGHEMQSAAQPLEGAMLRWIAYCGRSFPVGFHALYDATILARHARAALGAKLPLDWLDVGVLLPALHGENRPDFGSLDEWLDRCDIRCPVRHSALADAYATAQLFLRVLQMARDRGILDVQSLVALQKRHVDNQLRPAIAPVGA